MKVILWVVILSLALVAQNSDARRGGGGGGRGGGGRGGGGRGSGKGGSRRSGSKGSGSSYPKQKWSSSGTHPIGGGGWVNRNSPSYKTSAFVRNRGSFTNGRNYNTFGFGYGRQNYGYYGKGLFSDYYRSSGGLFGGGKKSFALGVGAGYIGGPQPSIAAISVYHRYRLYQSLHYRGILLDEHDCIGNCPDNAYCDLGMCRCKTGYDARYGLCWSKMEDFDWNQPMWTHRNKPDFEPFMKCENHEFCQVTDMNMICDEETSTCQCRRDMQWNSEALECQVFIVSNYVWKAIHIIILIPHRYL